MKSIYLEDFLQHIDGKVIHGPNNPMVQHILKTPKYSFLKDHSIHFHNGKHLSLQLPDFFSDLVIVTDKPNQLVNVDENITIVKVNNSSKSYWRFIDFYRNTFDIPFIAVTGTCGKTTTKEMVSWIFERNYKVYKTIESRNAPFRHLDYLMGIDEETDIVVMETAVAKPGHLKKAYRYFQPHIGILTSIGIDHLNGFPSLERYIKEKLSIFKLIDPDGVVIVNIDNNYVRNIDLASLNKHIVTIGKSEDADFRIDKVWYYTDGMGYTLHHRGKTYKFSLPGLGEHNVYNATIAIAAAYLLGVKIERAGERLQTFPHVPRHVEMVKGINGSLLIDDTWSTNPTSIQSALEVLRNIAKGKKKIAVFGEIKYLGDKSEEIHEIVGEMVANEDIDYLVTIGNEAEPIALRARELGMSRNRVYYCEKPQEAYMYLSELIDQNSVTLVKTSMFQSFNKFVGKLREDNPYYDR